MHANSAAAPTLKLGSRYIKSCNLVPFYQYMRVGFLRWEELLVSVYSLDSRRCASLEMGLNGQRNKRHFTGLLHNCSHLVHERPFRRAANANTTELHNLTCSLAVAVIHRVITPALVRRGGSSKLLLTSKQPNFGTCCEKGDLLQTQPCTLQRTLRQETTNTLRRFGLHIVSWT